MSKRRATASAAENPRNFWPTPNEAALPLANILPLFTQYDEPCAGDGQLIAHLDSMGHQCIECCDVEPRGPVVQRGDALDLPLNRMVITNPPFAWPLLQPLLDHWVGSVTTWLLLPWDMPCNARMSPYAVHIDRILPLGRVSWMRNGTGGFENYGWFRFSTEPQNVVLPRGRNRITGGT